MFYNQQQQQPSHHHLHHQGGNAPPYAFPHHHHHHVQYQGYFYHQVPPPHHQHHHHQMYHHHQYHHQQHHYYLQQQQVPPYHHQYFHPYHHHHQLHQQQPQHYHQSTNVDDHAVNEIFTHNPQVAPENEMMATEVIQEQPQPQTPPPPPPPTAAAVHLQEQHQELLRQTPWRVPALKEFRNARCDKCCGVAPVLLEHPLEHGRYCERCALAHGMLAHDPETGEFDHHTCHVCGGVECGGREQFRQHCVSKKHHIRLRRLRTMAPPSLDFDDNPPDESGSGGGNNINNNNYSNAKNPTVGSAATAAVDQVYSSLFHNALYTDARMCTHLLQHDIAGLPQFHFDDQDFITAFAAGHKTSRGKVVKFLCDFEQDQETLLNQCGISCIEDYGALQQEDARLQQIVRSSFAGTSTSSSIQSSSNIDTGGGGGDNNINNDNAIPLLRTIKIASPNMSAADRALLQHDLRTNTIFGFDTETANHQDFPYVKSALGYNVPHLLQLATLDRIWIFELSSTVEQDREAMGETLKQHRENSIQYTILNNKNNDNNNSVKSLFHHNAEANPLSSQQHKKKTTIDDSAAAGVATVTTTLPTTKRVQILDKKIDASAPPLPPLPPPPTSSSFVTLKEMKELDKKNAAASTTTDTTLPTNNNNNNNTHHFKKRMHVVRPVVSSLMFGGDDNYLGGGSDYDPNSPVNIEAAAAAVAGTRALNQASTAGIGIGAHHHQHKAAAVPLTIHDAVVAEEEARKAKELKLALEAAMKRKEELERHHEATTITMKQEQQEEGQEEVPSSSTTTNITCDKNNNIITIPSNAEALLELHIENELGKAEEENDDHEHQEKTLTGDDEKIQNNKINNNLILFSPPKCTQIMLFCSTQTLLQQHHQHQQSWIHSNNNKKKKHNHHPHQQQQFKWSQLINTSTGCTPVRLYAHNLSDPYPELTELLFTDSRKLLVGFAVGKDKELLANLVFGPAAHRNNQLAQSCFRAGVLDLSNLFCTTNVSSTSPPPPPPLTNTATTTSSSHNSNNNNVVGATTSSYMNPAGSCYQQQQQVLPKPNFFNPSAGSPLHHSSMVPPMVGLGQACARMFGRGFAKPKALSTSNWARRPLHRLQMVYAARDALFSRVVFDELQRRSQNSSRK